MGVLRPLVVSEGAADSEEEEKFERSEEESWEDCDGGVVTFTELLGVEAVESVMRPGVEPDGPGEGSEGEA